MQLFQRPGAGFFHTVVRRRSTPFIESSLLIVRPDEDLLELGYQLGRLTRIRSEDAPIASVPADAPQQDDDGDPFDLTAASDSSDLDDGALDPDTEDDELDELVAEQQRSLRERRLRDALGDADEPARDKAAIDATRVGFDRLADELLALSLRVRAQAPFASSRFLATAERQASTARAFNSELADLDAAMASTAGPRPRTWAGTGRAMFYRPGTAM